MEKVRKTNMKMTHNNTDSNADEPVNEIIDKLKGEREVGDGAPAPEVMPESSFTQTKLNQRQLKFNLQLQFNIDVMAVMLLAAAMCTRLYQLTEPKNVVFDELHYGRYVSLYLKGIFFFDSHPPLGKQLLYMAARVSGYDGSFVFDKIGTAYDDSVPIFTLRLVPALCGSMLVLLAYKIMLEMRSSQWTAILAALLIIFENAFLTQSRFMLMESILLMFAMFGILCILKFVKCSGQPYSLKWWCWLTSGSLFLGCAFSVKYAGFYTYGLALFLISREFWQVLGRKDLSNRMITLHFFWRVLTVTLVPLLVHLLVFYVHLSSLKKAGPHDSVMTSAFQASLEGGLASITKGQPLRVAHGSQITLRHTHGRTCWLHSHAHVYPVRYADKRGSSHQQQVSCYSFKDVNNWWIVKRPHKNELLVEEPLDSIRHGDEVQLVHGITSRALNSHDVAAPVSPQSQEVSCYIDYNVSMPAQNVWRVEIVNRESPRAAWHSIRSHVRLLHVDSGLVLKYSGRQLPDWGFHQHEVVADKVHQHDDTVWNVEEHRYTKSEDAAERSRQLVHAEMIPTEVTQLSFWDKFLELQYKMLLASPDAAVQNHMFSSQPQDWPFLVRGIAYWVSSGSNAQVHLIGNMSTWVCGSLGVCVYAGLALTYAIRRRRRCYDVAPHAWGKFVDAGCVFFVGYCLHYLPYYFVERTLFLHHYLSAYIFKILLLAFLVEHIYDLLKYHTCQPYLSNLFVAAVVLWLGYTIQTFRKFSVFNYGTTDLTERDLVGLRWRDTWDFILHKKT